MMKNIFLKTIIPYLFFCSVTVGQQIVLKAASENLNSRFLSNSIGDVIFSKNYLWLSGSKGLSKSSDLGKTWTNYYGIKEFVNPTIVSLAIEGDTIWAALVYDSSSIATGGGFTFSIDGGKSWSHVDQAKDNRNDSILTYGKNTIKALPVVVNQQNVTYGASILGDKIWINSWSSGLRKSTDLGRTFKRVILPPDNLNSISPDDTLNFQLNPNLNRNHLGFSVYAVDSLEIWAGTAGGVNRTTDGGISWKKFTYQSQTSHILGNWVIHINEQKFISKKRIWITNWKADDPLNEDYGLCYTENGGETWTTLLKGTKANYLAFKDSIIYVGTDNGIMRSDNDGKSFEFFNNIFDNKNGYKVLSPQIISIAVKNDTVWIGTADGLVYTVDNSSKKFGTEWNILRAFQSPKTNEAYAYPNPFSPNDESVRIHYKMPGTSSKITLDIFDFGMNHIKNIVNGITKTGMSEQEDIWNGKDKNNSRVPNGVYFYRLKIEDEIFWGKILVLE